MQKYFMSGGISIFSSRQRAEEMVYGIPAGENDGRVVQDFDFLLSEFPLRNGFDLNERTEIDLNRVFQRF